VEQVSAGAFGSFGLFSRVNPQPGEGESAIDHH